MVHIVRDKGILTTVLEGTANRTQETDMEHKQRLDTTVAETWNVDLV